MKTQILDIETHSSDLQKIDYRPYGEGVARRGFGGDIFDIESGFIIIDTKTIESQKQILPKVRKPLEG